MNAIGIRSHVLEEGINEHAFPLTHNYVMGSSSFNPMFLLGIRTSRQGPHHNIIVFIGTNDKPCPLASWALNPPLCDGSHALSSRP